MVELIKSEHCSDHNNFFLIEFNFEVAVGSGS